MGRFRFRYLNLCYIDEFLDLCKQVVKIYVKEQFKADLSLADIKVLWSNNDSESYHYSAILYDFSFDKDIYFRCILEKNGRMLEVSSFNIGDFIYHFDVSDPKLTEGDLDYFTTSLVHRPVKTGSVKVNDIIPYGGADLVASSDFEDEHSKSKSKKKR